MHRDLEQVRRRPWSVQIREHHRRQAPLFPAPDPSRPPSPQPRTSSRRHGRSSPRPSPPDCWLVSIWPLLTLMQFPHARAKVLRVLPSSLPGTSLLRCHVQIQNFWSRTVA